MAKVARTEALLWGLFTLGGMIAAFLMPAHIFMNSLGPQLGFVSKNAIEYGSLVAKLSNPSIRLYLLALIFGTLFHGMHRFKFVLYDLGFKRYERSLGIIAYAIVAIGTIAGAYTLITLP